MANTYVDYTASAAQTDFAFNFPYLEDEHVKVEINGVTTTAFTIVTSPALKVVLNSGATAGDIVRVRRVSQRDTNLVDFQNGSVLTEAELDRAYLHNRYLAEEISELNDQSLQIEAGGTNWNAKGLRIKNVGNPIDTTDASTKLYVDNKLNQVIYGDNAPLKWQFTGTAGPNTTYTVTGAEINGDTAYDVSINGLVQEPGVDFTVNPDTDTFTIVPTLSGGEDIVIIQRGFGVAVTGTIPSSSIINGAITTEKLAADAVNGSKIADNAIDSEHYVDGSIDTVHIANEAITSSKISTSDTNFNVQSDGRVCIGTASPSVAALTLKEENGGVQLEIGRTGSVEGNTWLGADANGFHLGVGNYGAGNNVANPNGMSITPDGYFGIGTSTPIGLFQASTLTSPLAGTVSVSAGSSVVTGIGTNFTSSLLNRPIKIASEVFIVNSVTSTTSLTLSAGHVAGASGVSAFVDDIFLLVRPSGEVLIQNLKLTGLSTYSNNAAALVGGLTTNDVYKTSTGELRIVV